MRRHLAAVALAVLLREIIDRQLGGRDPAAEHQPAITIITGDVIPIAQLNAERRQRFVTHPADMEMSFTLTIQALLTKIAVPALQQDSQESELLFLRQIGHKTRRNEHVPRRSCQ